MIPAITGLPVGPFATTTARESRTATPHTAARAVRMHGGGHETQARRALRPAGRLLSRSRPGRRPRRSGQFSTWSFRAGRWL